MLGNLIGYAVIVVDNGGYGGMEVITLDHRTTALHFTTDNVASATKERASQKQEIMGI